MHQAKNAGQYNQLTGGTADVVDYKLKPRRAAPDKTLARSADPVMQIPAIGPVLHLHCRRQISIAASAHPTTGSKPPSWLYPQGSSQAAFDLVCAQLTAYNLTCTPCAKI